MGFPDDSVVKNPLAVHEMQFQTLGQEDPPGGNGNPFQYSCLKNAMDQRTLVGCIPKGHKESDMSEQVCRHLPHSYPQVVYKS